MSEKHIYFVEKVALVDKKSTLALFKSKRTFLLL